MSNVAAICEQAESAAPPSFTERSYYSTVLHVLSTKQHTHKVSDYLSETVGQHKKTELKSLILNPGIRGRGQWEKILPRRVEFHVS